MRKLLFAVGAVAITFTVVLAQGSLKLQGEPESQYPRMAKVGPQNAISSPQAQVRGEVLGYELEDEDGYLVYGVKIADGQKVYDVKVDAGTGKVLKVDQEEGGQEHEED